MPEQDYVTVEEFAAQHDLDPNTVYVLLRKEVDLPDEQRRIPGAYKFGSKFRGEWRIPRSTAENWRRDPRGRPRDDK